LVLDKCNRLCENRGLPDQFLIEKPRLTITEPVKVFVRTLQHLPLKRNIKPLDCQDGRTFRHGDGLWSSCGQLSVDNAEWCDRWPQWPPPMAPISI